MFPTFLLLCASVAAPVPERGEVAFQPSPAEATVPARFQLEPARFAYELTPVYSTRRYNVSNLTFPSPIESPDAINNTVYAEFFDPVGFPGKRPAVVVLHILGADFPLSRYVAARLADQGVAALFVKLPYYGERRPPDVPGRPPRRFLTADMERSMNAVRQGVCDVRRAAAWLAARDDVDPARLGVTGISLGGVISSLAVSVDPQIRSGALLLAGGDLSKILWGMPEAAPFRKIWIEEGKTIADLKRLTEPYDPVTYAAGMVGKRVMMVAGNVDEVVPPESARALWEAGGKPPILWCDCGHYSAVGYLLPGIRRAVAFLGGEDPPEGR